MKPTRPVAEFEFVVGAVETRGSAAAVVVEEGFPRRLLLLLFDEGCRFAVPGLIFFLYEEKHTFVNFFCSKEFRNETIDEEKNYYFNFFFGFLFLF